MQRLLWNVAAIASILSLTVTAQPGLASSDLKKLIATAESKALDKAAAKAEKKAQKAVEKAKQADKQAKKSSPSASAAQSTDTSSIEAAIAASGNAYSQAFAAGDASALASLWTPEGVYVSEDGNVTVGRDAIGKLFAKFFDVRKGAKIKVLEKSTTPVNETTVVERGVARLDGDANFFDTASRYVVVHRKVDGKWLMDNVVETPMPAESPKLEDLSWLAGTWSAKSDNSQVTLINKWRANNHFLVCAFEFKEGDQTRQDMMILTYDPAANGIVSWLFDSEGGYGKANWTRSGDRWFIEASRRQPDGSRLTAVNVITRDGSDKFSWRSTQRTLDGMPVTDTAAVNVTRVSATAQN